MSFAKAFKRNTVAHLMFAITFFISGLMINFIQCLLWITLRPLSKYLYRKINYYLCYSFYSELVFMAEWWSGTDLIIYIDKEEFEKYYGHEHGYLLMNHTYEIDWLMGWIFCERIKNLGNCKAYAKKSIQYVPTLGWAFKFAEDIFLERNWDKDKDIIGRQITELGDYPDSMWLLLYAEGTRFTKKKHEVSEKFAKEKGLPVLKHHLTPRTKGFTASLPFLKGKVNAIYDIQLGFDGKASVKPTMTNLLRGEKCEAHLYIKRIPMSDVPDEEKEAAAWLHKRYQEKDKLADSFINTGDFFIQSGVPRPDTFRVKRRYYSMLNTILWAVIVLVPMLYYLVSLLLSGSTYYFSAGIFIIFLFYILMNQIIGMSEISKSSSYGEANKAN
ncbi:1-acyl-sn-glycerol-3-phosphate acyltransferase gamma [Fopius arisanus]|uniref:1-acyl-sn-glycerol-3-phosphate acyltransferase gamma n=2 Tax=Fopius arisanus TaxID=64838 RepID=A0A0C9R6T6_9HYME|nr:PREDICTED: 1-acyl-sn-glycerol-3-phosphate acyltransferase gamma-like [Fopius arisanus]XP_011311484.1 PREDICTED: 1-acyl-sn-glycerol-3-phosphate acyltransferase gamma-like [Fopius arisanus]XP_011311485.1 PREDICTED: 1-acyl-sn-glycerol-3-phosphate acyltransferase gamma-like [Fopius arisanus]XP_011311486.1 PREDICTED: 1-acyl-sn-glycerol-3-phosphate acyltransferase gamma-like [Fopius arisanus]XP_011311487.1 PREDICTED: 1-acyl-sn-glycerol-3-phosphate acyltransferase gamma-like [Fopius arisanus]XP_01